MASGWRYLAALGLLGSAVTGCAEEPSFRIRWRVEPPVTLDGDGNPIPPADAPTLGSPDSCTEVGINEIQIETYAVVDDDEVLVDERTRPCFPRSFGRANATAAGPHLGRGTYVVKLRGVRRDGATWSETITDELGNETTTELALVEVGPFEIENPDEAVRLQDEQERDPIVPAPPQCQDGIDNDGDGVVDAADPSCQLVGGIYEAGEAIARQFRMTVSFLDGNPNVVSAEHCAGLGVHEIRVQGAGGGLCDADNATEPRDDDCLLVLTCTDAIAKPSFFTTAPSQNLEAVEAVAVDAAGLALTTLQTFSISPTGLTSIDVDFADSDFLEPIVAPMAIGHRLFPGSANLNLCASNSGESVQIVDFLLEVLDGHGNTLPDPVLLDDGTLALDGQAAIPCQPAAYRTQDLTWGGYLIRASARSAAGEVCFTLGAGDEPPLHAGVPGSSVAFDPDDPTRGSVLTFQRVTDPVPESCIECTDDSDCGALMCRDSVCIECEDDADCTSGLVCRDTVCEPP